jgi:hypothetical protein
MNYSKGDLVLLSYPFTDLKTVKVRPAVVTCLTFAVNRAVNSRVHACSGYKM